MERVFVVLYYRGFFLSIGLQYFKMLVVVVVYFIEYELDFFAMMVMFWFYCRSF